MLVNFSGLFIPLMDPDAGVYASVSKNIVLHNDWLQLYFQNNDWLDKPHFQFWITAIFFKIFGIHTWSYKLPGILFVLLGAYYTYLLAKQFYNKTIALWSVLILLTAEHIIISNNDVRAEPFLTGLIIASVYHFYHSLKRNISWHLIAASLLAACAVMTKGPFTLIPIGGAIAGELIIERKWSQLFHWRWIIAIVLIAVFIIPELYSLWYQFDSHPEKTVFGKKNVSGIWFFLWEGQFGRFLNKAPIKGKGNPFFFLHTLLWAFLPWSLVMYASLINKIGVGAKKINYQKQEWLTISGSLLTLIVFSLSRFQLPYYSNIIFSFLAILTAQYIWKIQNTTFALFKIVQYSIIAILLAGGILLQIFYTPVAPSILLIIIIVGIIFLLIGINQWLKISGNIVAFYRAGLTAIVLNLYLNWFFYPDLLKYQSSSQAAIYANKKLPDVRGIHAGIYAPVFEFYISDPQFEADTAARANPNLFRPGVWYVNNEELNEIKEKGMNYESIKGFDDFHVTTLSAKFINKKTRSSQLKKTFLIRVI